MKRNVPILMSCFYGLFFLQFFKKLMDFNPTCLDIVPVETTSRRVCQMLDAYRPNVVVLI